MIRKVFHVTENRDGLGCINGIRVWSMVWVIAGRINLESIIIQMLSYSVVLHNNLSTKFQLMIWLLSE